MCLMSYYLGQHFHVICQTNFSFSLHVIQLPLLLSYILILLFNNYAKSKNKAKTFFFRYAGFRRHLLIDPHVSKEVDQAPDLVMENPLSQNPGILTCVKTPQYLMELHSYDGQVALLLQYSLLSCIFYEQCTFWEPFKES